MVNIKQKLNLYKKDNYLKIKNRGFIILFSMLISSLILLVSSGIYNVVQKQVVLSSYARESQKAFYAADAALDCALYNDISPLITQTAFLMNPPTIPYSAELSCGTSTDKSRVYLLDTSTTGDDNFEKAFVFRYFTNQYFNTEYVGAGCAYVLVEKKGGGITPVMTRITASGFNTCIESIVGSGVYDVPDFDDPKLLERRMSIRYETN